MGRMFYATPNQSEDNRIVHVITTELGTVVLAFRHPRLGEQAFAVGIDRTVRDVVKEILTDWDPNGPPGWPLQYISAARPMDETFTVTILAACDNSHPTVADAIGLTTDDDRLTAWATVDERSDGRWFQITEGEDDGYEIPVNPLDFDVATHGSRVSISYSVTPSSDRPIGLARVVEVGQTMITAVTAVTADTITDEQIASVRDNEALSMTARTCASACLDYSIPRSHPIKLRNRARCAEILNARAAAVADAGGAS